MKKVWYLSRYAQSTIFSHSWRNVRKAVGYYCTGQYVDVTNRFIVQPGYRTRILGTQMYKYQLDGFLHWGYNFYNAEHSIFPIDPYRW